MNKSFRIIFAGTPEFSVKTLDALIHSQHEVIAVYTQPDRPSGRGQKLTASPVKQLALQNEIPVYQPLTLRDAHAQQELADLKADLMIVVAYGLILPQAVLDIPSYGCINVHASLLPRWRGAAPIQRAILAGDAVSGVTIMQMDKGLDTGDMLLKAECEIAADETSESLHDKLAVMGAEALIQTLAKLSEIAPQAQDNSQATYAAKIVKEEAKLNWQLTATELDRVVRAFNPWPVAYMHCGEQTVRVWQAAVSALSATNKQPGEIVHVSSEGIDVATADGVLSLKKIQMPGGRVLSVADVLNARRNDFIIGTILR